LIAYFVGNIFAKKYQNPFTYVKVSASQRWNVFLRHGVGLQCAEEKTPLCFRVCLVV